MKFVLCDHAGSGNHGCEALVRTVSDMFGREKTWLLSENPEEEERYGIVKQMQVFPALNKRKISRWEWLYAYGKLKLQKNYFYMDALPYKAAFHNLNREDILVSIGGDVFCYDHYPKYHLIHRYARKRAKTSMLIGCSIEPELLKDRALRKDLKSFDVILAREHVTCAALKKAGISGVQFCPDSAFCLPATQTTLPETFLPGNTVGINISPLILRKSQNPGLLLENLRVLIRDILENTTAAVALIPHVVWESNDDRIPLGMLWREFKDSKRVCLVEDQGAEQLKWIISKCSYFVGARTHAVIAAYSSAVPALAIGYSVKTRGIAEDLFGAEEAWIVSYQDITSEKTLLSKFCKMKEQTDVIRKILKKKTRMYQQQIQNMGGELRNYAEQQSRTQRKSQHHNTVL